MPQLTVDYTDNLAGFDGAQTLRALNDALVATGQFQEIDIKSRAVRLDVHQVGTPAGQPRSFVHARLAILSGRSPETKRQVSAAMLAALQQLHDWPSGVHVQLCAEILDIDRDSYAKAVVGG